MSRGAVWEFIQLGSVAGGDEDICDCERKRATTEDTASHTVTRMRTAVHYAQDVLTAGSSRGTGTVTHVVWQSSLQ